MIIFQLKSTENNTKAPILFNSFFKSSFRKLPRNVFTSHLALAQNIGSDYIHLKVLVYSSYQVFSHIYISLLTSHSSGRLLLNKKDCNNFSISMLVLSILSFRMLVLQKGGASDNIVILVRITMVHTQSVV